MRHKGKLSKATLDRDWPHQVVLPESKITGANHVRIREFCKGLSLAPLGHTFNEGHGYQQVFCFAEHEHAEGFAAEFGGRFLDPKDRPRWPGRSPK